MPEAVQACLRHSLYGLSQVLGYSQVTMVAAIAAVFLSRQCTAGGVGGVLVGGQ